MPCLVDAQDGDFVDVRVKWFDHLIRIVQGGVGAGDERLCADAVIQSDSLRALEDDAIVILLHLIQPHIVIDNGKLLRDIQQPVSDPARR